MIRTTALAASLWVCVTSASARSALVDELADLRPWVGTWTITTDDDDASIVAFATCSPILQGQFLEVHVVAPAEGDPGWSPQTLVVGAGPALAPLPVHAIDRAGLLRRTELITTNADELVLSLAGSLAGLDGAHELRRAEDGTLGWSVDGAERGTWTPYAGTTPALRPATRLVEPLRVLTPFLGVWEVDTHWQRGGSLWARTIARASADGSYVHSRVLARESDGVTYDRYRSFFLHDPENDSILELVFTRSGEVIESELRADPDEPTTLVSTTPPERPGAPTIVKTTRFDRAGVMGWTVELEAPGQPKPRLLVEGAWNRLAEEIAMTEPIRTELFVAGGPNVRRFTCTETIAAPVSEVYTALSDGAAFRKAYAPDRKELVANIDLAIGGRYEWLFDGTVGSNECQVLSYLPDRMISFSWHAPVAQADSRAKRTWVVVETEPVDGGATRVTLTHLGFGSGVHWDETFEYFSNAWPYVLSQLKKNLEAPVQ